jgi:WD40 repeat protein
MSSSIQVLVNLPLELLLQVWSYVSVMDFISFDTALTNRRLREDWRSTRRNVLLELYLDDEYVIDRKLKGHKDQVRGVVQLADGRLVTACWDKTIRLWNVRNGACQQILTGHTFAIQCMIPMRDGRFASCGNDSTVIIWRVKEKTKHPLYNLILVLLYAIDAILKRFCFFDISIEINKFATSLQDACCYQGYEQQHMLIGHSNFVCCLVQLVDGRIASGSLDKTIKLWNTNTGSCEVTLKGLTHSVLFLKQLPDSRLASCDDTTIRIWNVVSGECEVSWKAYERGLASFVVLSDGRLVSRGEGGIVKVWNVMENECICEQTFPRECKLIYKNNKQDLYGCILVLADGHIAIAIHDTIQVLNIKTGCLKIMQGHTNEINRLIQLTDGRIVSCSRDRTVKIWNIVTGACEHTLNGHEGNVVNIFELLDGRIVSCHSGKNFSLLIWRYLQL